MVADLKLFRGGKTTSIFFVVIEGNSKVEDFFVNLRQKHRREYEKLMAFMERISENGTEPWKGNDEKYKFIETHRGYTIWKIKQWGLRVLDIEKGKNLILLDAFQKKQKKMNKKNLKNLDRAKRTIDILHNNGVMNGLE